MSSKAGQKPHSQSIISFESEVRNKHKLLLLTVYYIQYIQYVLAPQCDIEFYVVFKRTGRYQQTPRYCAGWLLYIPR